MSGTGTYRSSATVLLFSRQLATGLTFESSLLCNMCLLHSPICSVSLAYSDSQERTQRAAPAGSSSLELWLDGGRGLLHSQLYGNAKIVPSSD